VQPIKHSEWSTPFVKVDGNVWLYESLNSNDLNLVNVACTFTCALGKVTELQLEYSHMRCSEHEADAKGHRIVQKSTHLPPSPVM